MKPSKILIPLYFASITYFALLVFFGPGGIIRMSSLDKEYILLEENLAKIESIGVDLSKTYTDYLSNSDTIIEAARLQGFVQAEEKIMHIPINNSKSNLIEIGTFKTFIEPEYHFDFFINLASFSVFIVSLLIYNPFRKQSNKAFERYKNAHAA